ncbi:MAG: ABC transporter permease [Erysipelotrichaceae bacterium]|nr:ABC transporter permease [Erysipelotrichaceae bacterium]MDD3923799.1 ABC transporter permease [Erysipelotrichaceae bacterium]MDD4641876.1 ABC transporter permease [Erysipelotrichaceae bacterium]
MLVYIEIINQGLLYSLLAMGVMISYKILDFPDLSVDGTVPLGGVTCAVLLMNNVNPLLALLGGFISGVLAGLVTALLHVKFKLSGLLSGILVMSGLYSINLLIAGYTASLPLFAQKTIFNLPTLLANIEPLAYRTLVKSIIFGLILLVVVVLVKLVIDWFLKTKLGFLIRITGDNPQLVTALGQDIGKMKYIALALSNGIVALFGALYVQYAQVYNLSVGSGMVVIGLASVIMGVSIFNRFSFLKLTTMVMIGSLLYRLAIGIALQIGVPTYFEKLITVILFVTTIVLHDKAKKKSERRNHA